MIAKFAKILRVTGVKTGVGVLIFDVNRSRIGVGFCNFGAGLESESQKSDSGHLCLSVDHALTREYTSFNALELKVVGFRNGLKNPVKSYEKRKCNYYYYYFFWKRFKLK